MRVPGDPAAIPRPIRRKVFVVADDEALRRPYRTRFVIDGHDPYVLSQRPIGEAVVARNVRDALAVRGPTRQVLLAPRRDHVHGTPPTGSARTCFSLCPLTQYKVKLTIAGSVSSEWSTDRNRVSVRVATSKRNSFNQRCGKLGICRSASIG